MKQGSVAARRCPGEARPRRHRQGHRERVMNASQFTPGPWMVLPSIICGHFVILTMDGRWVEVAHTYGADDSHREANARLIASAPELFVLLKEWVNDCADCLEDGEANQLVSATRDAIARVLLADGHYFSASDVDLASAAIERARKHGVGSVWSDFPGSEEPSHG